MTMRRLLPITILALVTFVIGAGVVIARNPATPGNAPVAQISSETSFTYQGRLNEAGDPAITSSAWRSTFPLGNEGNSSKFTKIEGTI